MKNNEAGRSNGSIMTTSLAESGEDLRKLLSHAEVHLFRISAPSGQLFEDVLSKTIHTRIYRLELTCIPDDVANETLRAYFANAAGVRELVISV